MSTSLMYHAFGATTYNHSKTEYKDGAIYFHLEKKRDKQRCVACRSKNVTHEGKEMYTLRSVPIGARPVFFACSCTT